MKNMLCKALHTWTRLPPTDNVPPGNSAAFLMSRCNTWKYGTPQNRRSHWPELVSPYNPTLEYILKSLNNCSTCWKRETTLSPTFQTPPRHWQMRYQMEPSHQCQKLRTEYSLLILLNNDHQYYLQNHEIRLLNVYPLLGVSTSEHKALWKLGEEGRWESHSRT